MKTKLLLLLSLLLLFSCGSNIKKEKNHELEKMVMSFSITAKNPELTSKQGLDVSTSEMVTKKLVNQGNILFQNYQFTLDNPIAGALNFYSEKGKLMCKAPVYLSVMSMPPDGTGPTIYTKGDNIEFTGTSLIKINDAKFVISNIQYSK